MNIPPPQFKQFPAVLVGDDLDDLLVQVEALEDDWKVWTVNHKLSIYQYLTSNLFGSSPQEIKNFLLAAKMEDGWTPKGLVWAHWLGACAFWIGPNEEPHLLLQGRWFSLVSPPPRTKIEKIVTAIKGGIAPPSPQEVAKLIQELEYTQDKAAISYLMSAVDSWGE